MMKFRCGQSLAAFGTSEGCPSFGSGVGSGVNPLGSRGEPAIRFTKSRTATVCSAVRIAPASESEMVVGGRGAASPGSWIVPGVTLLRIATVTWLSRNDVIAEVEQVGPDRRADQRAVPWAPRATKL